MAPGTWGANRHFQGFRFLDKPLTPLLVPFDQIFFLCVSAFDLPGSVVRAQLILYCLLLVSLFYASKATNVEIK